MDDKRFSAPAVLIRLSEDVTPDIQLFRTGKFYHDEYGEFEITTKLLAEMKRNFDEKARGIDIAVDYKHASEDVAAGWIKEVYLSEDGKELWGKVEWTPNGRRVLSEKEFRYVSPEFTFDYQDNETLKKHGPVLLGAGLTNRPVIKKMEPVIELHENKIVRSAKSPSDKQKQKNTPIKGGESMQDGEKKIEGAMVPEGSDLSKLSPEELVKMIQELQGKLKEMEEMKLKSEGEAKLAERKATFAKMLAEGKVCAAQESPFISGDMVKFAELQAKVNLKTEGSDNIPEPKEEIPAGSEEDQVLKFAEELIKDKKAKDMVEAIRMVLAERPELNQKIYG